MSGWSRVGPGTAVSPSYEIPIADSKIRGRFEGVDGGARSSQRPDRFDGGVAVGVGAAAAEPGLGKWARSRTWRAR